MSWLKKHWIIIAVLVAYTLIIFLPPMIYGYVYPNNGDDTAFHLRYFSAIQSGGGGSVNYLGQNLVGYPLVWVSNLMGTSIDTLYLWFNFVVLWLVGIVAFAVIGKLVDWRAGLVAIPMVMFVTPSTLNLYDTGAIYDLMTIGIIFPFTLFCLVKLWTSRKWYWILPLLLSAVLVVVVHTSVIWSGAKFANPKAEMQVPSLSQFISVFLGYTMLIGFLAVLFWMFQTKKLRAKVESWALVVCLSAVVVALTTLMFTGFMGWSVRIALDLSIVFPLLVACLLGILMRRSGDYLIWGLVCAVVVVASLPVVVSYERYNSAVKPVDLRAIAYVNALKGDYYSCSPEVAPWVYGRFVNKEYKDGELPYIQRSMPMTPRVATSAEGYWWSGTVGGSTYDPQASLNGKKWDGIATFEGDGVGIMVVY